MKTKFRNKKTYDRRRRHMRVRNTISGTADRPRACVYRSNTHIYAQIIDDSKGITIASVSSLKLDAKAIESAAPEQKEGKKGKKAAPAMGRKVLQARAVGKLLAEVAKEKGVTKISFDRGGNLYHGRVAALAAAARENGLEF